MLRVMDARRGVGYCNCARGRAISAYLQVDVGDVALNRPHAEDEHIRNLMVAQTPRDQHKDFALPRGQPISSGASEGCWQRPDKPGKQLAGFVSFGDGADKAEVALSIACLGDGRLVAAKLGEDGSELPTGPGGLIKAARLRQGVACVFKVPSGGGEVSSRFGHQAPGHGGGPEEWTGADLPGEVEKLFGIRRGPRKVPGGDECRDNDLQPGSSIGPGGRGNPAQVTLAEIYRGLRIAFLKREPCVT